jgi:hypothetical protein
MLVIPATWKAELRKISGFQASLGKKVLRTPFQQEKKKSWVWSHTHLSFQLQCHEIGVSTPD